MVIDQFRAIIQRPDEVIVRRVDRYQQTIAAIVATHAKRPSWAIPDDPATRSDSSELGSTGVFSDTATVLHANWIFQPDDSDDSNRVVEIMKADLDACLRDRGVRFVQWATDPIGQLAVDDRSKVSAEDQSRRSDGSGGDEESLPAKLGFTPLATLEYQYIDIAPASSDETQRGVDTIAKDDDGSSANQRGADSQKIKTGGDEPSGEVFGSEVFNSKFSSGDFLSSENPQRGSGISPIEFLPVDWQQESSRRAFTNIVAETYRDTMDCPGFVQYRSPSQTLAGYRDAGSYAKELWLQIHDAANRPVGCLLLGKHGTKSSLVIEIVYMGVVPMARGNGLGRAILKEVFAIAKRLGAVRVILAVDENNTAAGNVYRACGFQSLLRETVWVKTIDDEQRDG